MPIDIYIGGREHATMHDIYFRFYTKFLRDIGLLKFSEPAKQLFNQGFILGKDGNKMSKSKTPLFRASYPQLFEPKAMKQGGEKYSLTMIFDTDADLKEMRVAVK